MKRNIMKALLVLGFVIIGGFTLTLVNVSAESVYDDVVVELDTVTDETNTSYTIEEMLNYALQDEYLARAEYLAIIETYGEIRPFTNVILAEETHINLLLPLFETYGVTATIDNSANYVVIPESITAAYATGIDAEQANITMYETFLAQTDLPDDIKNVFTYLRDASMNHLNAFEKDHYSCLGTDMVNQIKNQFRKGNQNGTGEQTMNQYKGSNGNQGTAYAYSKTSEFEGVCPNL
ncbi:MAG: DUF2202 domain-containing protein [Firmicutes bacterium]|nr:DUF2202 domain-containing protein [Bacillota bacterium]